MPKVKTIDEAGQTIPVETERFQKQPITVSHTEAKKLVKKQMTEKQAEHVKKLVEANKAKYEQRRLEKEQALKAEVDKRVEEEVKKRQENKIVDVVVAPKRQYKPRAKKQIIIEESETESEEEEEVIIVKKPKAIPRVKAVHEDLDTIHKKIEAVNKIDSLLNQNKYSNMIRF